MSGWNWLAVLPSHTPGIVGQVEPDAGINLLPILIIVILLFVLFYVLAKLRKRPTQVEREERPRAEEPRRPKVDVLEDRPEVEEPVEIHEGMSLAEIKRAKRARVVGEKGRRETAAEATERAKREQEKAAAAAQAPVADEPAAEEPVVEEPVAEEPVVEAPVAEAPVSEVPAAEEPVAEEPVAEEPVAEEPVVEEPVAEEPAAEEPAPEKSVAKPEPALPRPSSLPTETAPSEDAEPAASAPQPDKPRLKLQDPAAITTPKPEAPAKPAGKLPLPRPASAVRVVEKPVQAEAPKGAEKPADEVAAEHQEIHREIDRAERVEPKSLRDGLQKTRTGFVDRLGSLFKRERLDEDLVDEIEEILFTADIGTRVAQNILTAVEEHLDSDDKRDPAAVWAFVREYCEGILKAHENTIDFEAHTPFVMLVIGVNGVGKTTTIGKLAAKLRREGKSVLVVAGDTFRAAAVDQLAVWAERTGIPIHAGEDQADPSSVIFSGIERGVREGADVIICDTAGRLHTKSNLLDELEKMGRVAGKALNGAPHETILVLDANTGQNAIAQAKLFKEALDITGIVLTKLDGTAKGGVILGICDELKAPVRYIGIGEGIDDLRRFDAEEFVEALFM